MEYKLTNILEMQNVQMLGRISWNKVLIVFYVTKHMCCRSHTDFHIFCSVQTEFSELEVIKVANVLVHLFASDKNVSKQNFYPKMSLKMPEF